VYFSRISLFVFLYRLAAWHQNVFSVMVTLW